jgi:hypothetical protein
MTHLAKSARAATDASVSRCIRGDGQGDVDSLCAASGLGWSIQIPRRMVGTIVARFFGGGADKALEEIGEIRVPGRSRFIARLPCRPPTEDHANQDRHNRTENEGGG